MQGCYADHATFSDSVFINLNANQARAMWQMLISRGKDLVLEFKVVSSNGNQVQAEWVAYYTFGATKRQVCNHIKAEFEVVDGKIVRHIDRFDFHTWAKQALGPIGLLLGWTPYLQNKVRQTAMKGLNDFIEKNN